MIDLGNFPYPHTGVNVHTMRLARICQLKGVAQDEALRAIWQAGQNLRPGRRLKRAEVERAVSRAYGSPVVRDDTWAPAPKEKKEAWEPAATVKCVSRYKGMGLYDLWEASPIRCDEGLTQADVLRSLFPDPAGLICAGMSAFDFRTATLEEHGDLSGHQFIVSSYMSKREGLTQDGKPSQHSLDNTGERLYCVCDFDDPSSDQHPAIIWELKDIAPLVLVVSSGGKSLHSWHLVPEAQQPAFWKAAIQLGADPALMRNRSSFVRMPGGIRDTGKEQTIFYFRNNL